MSKKIKGKELSDEYLELIRVKPEDTQRLLDKLPYTITPRPDEKAPRGNLWCPYESKWSKFGSHKDHPSSTLARCLSCGISIEDFHVKTTNRLWGDSTEKKER